MRIGKLRPTLPWCFLCPLVSMAPVPWRLRVWWQTLHPPVMKASTPFERLSSRSAPGPNRALAHHAPHTERTTMPNTRKKHAKPQRSPDPTAGLPPLNLNAAGIDVGSAEHYVAVPPDRSPEPVRRFASFTADLHALADWLHACHIDTVVMESTGVSWIPLFQILEGGGFSPPFGKPPPRQKPARPQNRYRRLPVAPKTPHLRSAQ